MKEPPAGYQEGCIRVPAGELLTVASTWALPAR
jgi:hypothetical protein